MNRLFMLILVMPLPALAEVSDKMASISQLWLQGLVIAVVLLLLIRWLIWFSILGALVVAIFLLAAWATFTAPHIGPAILGEHLGSDTVLNCKPPHRYFCVEERV